MFITFQVGRLGLSCSCGKVKSKFFSNMTEHLDQAHEGLHKTFICDLCDFSCQRNHNKLWGHLSETAHKDRAREASYRLIMKNKLLGPKSARNVAPSETSDSGVRSETSTPKSQASVPRSPDASSTTTPTHVQQEPLYTLSADKKR